MRLVLALIIVFLVVAPSVRAQDCEEGVRRICGTEVGICEPGRSTCRDGKWSECEGGRGPDYSDECGNGLDDDCDGETDENCFPWVSFVLVGGGLLFIGIGLIYIQHSKGERMVSEGLAKD